LNRDSVRGYFAAVETTCVKKSAVTFVSIRAAGAMLAAAALFGCVGEVTPGTAQRTEKAVPAAVSASKIRFSMDKWLDANGSETQAVEGGFTRFSVDLDQVMDFERLVGASATVSVDLTSLETGSEARDVNIEEAYFETSRFTSATVDFLITESSAAGADGQDDAGEHVHVRAEASLTLHGTTASLGSVELLVSRVDEGLRVRTKQPIAVPSSSFGMPVAALLERCGHKGIADAALIDADVVVPR
jgi:polyisoprenoid-binding protein YceI